MCFGFRRARTTATCFPERQTQRTQDSVPSVVYVTCVQRGSIRLVRYCGGKVTPRYDAIFDIHRRKRYGKIYFHRKIVHVHDHSIAQDTIKVQN